MTQFASFFLCIPFFCLELQKHFTNNVINCLVEYTVNSMYSTSKLLKENLSFLSQPRFNSDKINGLAVEFWRGFVCSILRISYDLQH